MTTDAGTKRQPWIGTDSTFGARLALVRQRMGWGNVKTAAEACGLPVESWRNWERDGMEPRRLVTIAMSISTRTGCDLLWLVHGPDRGGAAPSGRYGPEPRIVATIGAPTMRVEAPESLLRPVRQTRPIIDGSPRPLTLSRA